MSDLVKINRKQRLYVLACGAGYTCLGFDRADAKRRVVDAWCGVTSLDVEAGTPEAYEAYRAAMARGAARGGRCEADLTPQLVGLEGRRVEVVDRYGERRRFWVGKSTGWMPVHLEVSRRTSTGGVAVDGAPFSSVTVVR